MSWGEVRLADGTKARLRLSDSGGLSMSEPWTALRLPSGQELLVPTETIVDDGEVYHLPISLHDLGLDLKTTPESTVIPVIQEELEVSRRTVETEQITVQTILENHKQIVDELLLTETIEIERVPLDHEVPGPQAVRYEGDLVIIPVVEEVLVVTKRFVLKEEVRVRRRRVDVPTRQEVTVRRQTAQVVREQLPGDA